MTRIWRKQINKRLEICLCLHRRGHVPALQRVGVKSQTIGNLMVYERGRMVSASARGQGKEI